MSYTIRYIVVYLFLTGVSISASGVFVNITGNVIIGAMFPIHSAAPGYNCSAGNGEIDQAGMQNLEALLFSLHKVNTEVLNGTGLTLGALAFDTCYSEMVALESALQLVRLQHNFVDSSAYVCPGDEQPPRPKNAGKIIGVIGAATSGVSIQLASFLRLFQIPQISYGATSPELSDTSRYDYFLRTVASDLFQVQAIVDILKTLSWNYVTVVYEDTSYGKQGLEEVMLQTGNINICVAHGIAVKKYYITEQERQNELSAAVNTLLQYNNTEGQIVVILFTSLDIAEGIFEQVVNKALPEHTFVWIGTDAWAGRTLRPEVQHVAYNAIGVQPLIEPVSDFDKYFHGLNPTDHDVINPWFKTYWSEQFNCSFGMTSKNKKTRPCFGNETFSSTDGTYNRYLNTYSVMDAVYAFAHAALALYEENNCTNSTCPGLEKINGTQVLTKLKNVSFTDPAGLGFIFRNNSGPPRYSLLRHVRKGRRYFWESTGSFGDKDDNLGITWANLSELKVSYSRSVCSESCGRGYAMSVTNKCCWTCIPCQQYQYATKKTNGVGQTLSSEMCFDCPMGHKPNFDKTGCDVIPETTMNFGEPWAIISIVLSSLGLIMTLIMGVVFYRNKDTPIIMASGKELSFVLLIGILMSYTSSLVFVSYPNVVSCGATRLMLGLCYTICYSAILVKTNRIYRVFNIRTKKPKKVKFIDAKSQLMITFIIIMVELASLVTWIVFDSPQVLNVFPTRSENIRVCEDSKDFAYLGALVYPFFLMVLCVVYAVKTRKTPDGFNETRFITFGSYSFCIMWIAFISIYFTVKNNTVRIVSLCFASFINATVTLITLFMTKAYVVIFQPQKNTKENVMSRRRTHSYETVDMYQMSNLSRMVSAVSTWHSVYVNNQTGSQGSGNNHNPAPKNHLNNAMSVSVISVNNIGQSKGSNSSLPSVFPSSPKRSVEDSSVTGLSYRTSSCYSDDGVLANTQKFDDIMSNHVLTRSRESLNDEIPKLHLRRSLRSMKSRRRRRRSAKRTRSFEIPPFVPNIIVTQPSEERLAHNRV